MGMLLEHLTALEFAPEFAQSGKRAIGERTDAVMHDALDAIIAARNGDNKKFNELQTLNHFSFVAYAKKLFDSGTHAA